MLHHPHPEEEVCAGLGQTDDYGGWSPKGSDDEYADSVPNGTTLLKRQRGREWAIPGLVREL